MSRPVPKRDILKDENGGKPVKRKKKEESDDLVGNFPVRIERIRYGAKISQPPPPISLTSDLDDLMFPMPSKAFLESCFRKKAVHITCEHGNEEEHAEKRVTGLREEMCGLDPETILRETSSDNIFLWLRKKGSLLGRNNDAANKTKHHNNDLIQSIAVSDVDTAIALHKTAGHATYCRAPPRVEQKLVASLLRATGLGCGQYDPSGQSMICMGRGEVETFISTDDHVTNWHFDFQENFTIQLSGIKRWTIQQGTIQDPIRGCTPHYAAPEAVEAQLKAAHLFDRKFRFGYPETGVTANGEVVSVDLKPGDVFYFPAGMWHKVETIEPGVSINVSLMASNYATLACQALQQFLYKDQRWREPVINNPTKNVIQHLNGLLKELPSLIQGLKSQGAEAIIPPILQYPPTFRLAEDDEWENVEEDKEDAADDTEKYGSDEEELENDGGTEESAEEGPGYGADDPEDVVVDPLEFDNYPSDWNVDIPPGVKVKLRRNPLAALHRLDEITSFYGGGGEQSNSSSSSCCQDDGVFVLNINYVGNEMHQSAVRILFRESQNRMVQKIYEWERRRGNSDDNSLEVIPNDSDHLHIKFLVYHGYLQIISKGC